MAADKVYQPTGRDEFEIAIVCTRALEYDAVCLLLDGFWDTDGDPFGRARGDLNTYTTGYMGKYNVVVVLLCNPGKANSAGATASLRSSYPCIELLLLTGICEGVPDANGEELLLGDVVVSETVIQYDLGTQHAAVFKERDTLEDQHGRANKNIRNFTAHIKTEIGYQRLEGKAATFLEQIQSRTSETKYQRRHRTTTYTYPGSVHDILFESTHCHRHYNSTQCVCADYNPDEDSYAACEESKLMDCEHIGCEVSSLRARARLNHKAQLESRGDLKSAQIPSIFLGRFGSGDTAFRSGIHRDSLAKKHNIIAFEMEGAGVWDELPCIIVKGVSEYGDGHKAKNCTEWQNFAAATAASVARALVERYPQTDKSPAAALKLLENKACLNALFVTNPEDDKQRIEETKGGLLLDAYVWIIQNKEFIQWLTDPVTRLLWIKGGPGKGKTMMLCGIINELQMTSPRGNVYYFLCQATDDRLNNASSILRGLLHMMVVQQPSLISCIRHEYDKSGKSAFEGINSWVVLSRIFEQMLESDSLKSRKIIFIIDALDECVADSTQFLEMIKRNLQSSSQVKWLMASRNEADIQEALAAAENKSTVSLELNAESVSTAITTYIRHKVQLLADKNGYTQPTKERIQRYLSENASGTFLWVALVCALLNKVPRSDPLPKSADFPPGLDQLYEQMINRVCEPSVSDISRKVLAITAVAYRPLTKEEIILLVNNGRREEIMPPSNDDWEDILGHCGSFLTIRGGTIYFVHQSAKDFLVKEGSQRIFPNGVENVHRELLEVSIALMRNTLRKDIYALVDYEFSIDDLSKHTLSDDPLIPIRYYCIYWIEHFEQSIRKSSTDTHASSNSHVLIYTFLKENFIYWLEALSLLRGIFDGIMGMQRLEQLVAYSEESGIFELVRDACKFMQTFGSVIADYPLQVYVSALIFSPTQSLTRLHFKKETPKWIQTLPNDESEWAPSSRTFEINKEIEGLAVSCCGTWIASSHSKATITIWETYSGKITRVLNMPRFFSHHILVCFSLWNREELVSSNRDESIQISATNSTAISRLLVWDIKTGKALQKVPIKGNTVSISFLGSEPNILGCLFYRSENYDISGALDDAHGILTALIWNTKTGQSIKEIQLQETTSRALLSIFSPTDFSEIACRRGSQVEIINIDTGDTTHILMDPRREVRHMKFSPDGSFLVLGRIKHVWSSSYIYVITLSDVSSGEMKWSFQTGTFIDDITFSPDGQLLMIVTYEGIELLSTMSGKCLRKMIMRSSRLIFSSDGSKMFSVYDSMVSVIDIGQGSFIGMGSGDSSAGKPSHRRSCVSLSPNGRISASAFENNLRSFIEIMEIRSTNSIYYLTPNANQPEVKGLYFSPDSKKLVVIFYDSFVLWDISSETPKIILEGEISNTDFKPAFSSDSERLVTAFFDSHNLNDFKVQVWDTGSANCLMCLRERSRRTTWERTTYHLCFSPDGERLVISHMDHHCILRVESWDIASCSAIQTINFSEQDLERNFSQCSPEIKALNFIGEGHIVLDVKSAMNLSRQRSNIRVVLRMRMDQELTDQTSSLIRFKEAKMYELDPDNTWVKFNGKKLVWIPPQYRSEHIFIERNFIALPHRLGRSVSIIQFRHSELVRQISPPHISITGNVPCVSGVEEFTHLCELDDNWEILYRDMNEPDDKIMDKLPVIESAAASVITEITHRNMRQRFSRWKRRIFHV